jgi:DNA excision repair protein ERCC-3
MLVSRGKPLIVQGDRTVFLEVDHPDFEAVRSVLMTFAELEKSPEHVHVYRITPLSLWNAAAAGMSAESICEFLTEFGKYPVPSTLRKEITEFVARYGLLKLVRTGTTLQLYSAEPSALADVLRMAAVGECMLESEPSAVEAGFAAAVRAECRGHLKLALIRLGYPVEDVAGYRDGAALTFDLRRELPSRGAAPFALRPYQTEAVEAFYASGSAAGGSGVVVLPCGAGKTIVGIGVLYRVQSQALIISTNITALRQWRRELLEKTNLDPEQIGEYSGDRKEIRPITLTTYQMLTFRKKKLDELVHFRLFSARDWGLIIYDEVHLLPAPVFRLTAEIQATRRLGLTATLVREDGREDEVFSLIGPRKYDLPWRSLEAQGWIANASCVELRCPLGGEDAQRYLTADRRGKFRIASENATKLEVLKSIVQRHRADRVLIIGQYLDQLKRIQRELAAPIITGKTPSPEREKLYASFRSGDIPVLIVSKVGNFAVDLPDANVAVQISGTFGSRQEEAQRLGRILRPKTDGGPAVFYSIVTRESRDQEFAEKRQLFLTEQGYHYTIREVAASGLLPRESFGAQQDSA